MLLQEALDAAWEEKLVRLEAYKAVHGDCNVPLRWADDKQLGKWVVHQRGRKRKLDRGEPSKGMTAERAARLTALGLVWDQNEAKWEAQLARLVAYKAKHGDCSVPQDSAADSALGRWVNSQRVGKRKLDRGEPSEGMTVARAARLTALGLVWDPGYKGGSWETQLARLAAYKAVHGDCSVPQRWAEDLQLGNWVCQQRRVKQKLDRGEPSKGMTAERAARLTALGLVWDPGYKGGPSVSSGIGTY
jgi:hypothetical protein